MGHIDESARKTDHLRLAQQAQVSVEELNDRFNYEPLFSAHPKNIQQGSSLNFLGKTLKAPIWISSLTGGTKDSLNINRNLATVARKYGLGLGLGSCRPLLNGDNSCFDHFNLRPILGSDLPLFANLGIAQLENLMENNQLDKISNLIDKLDADGVTIHINPIQEWLQPEGNRLKKSPIETITRLLDQVDYKVIVKEVGQGFGPKSLESLLRLPLSAIEFGAFGGTNFSRLELLRSQPGDERVNQLMPMAHVGHTAEEMVTNINKISKLLGDDKNCHEFIISGGVSSFLDGFYLTNKLEQTCVYGQARSFLEHAQNSYEELDQFVSNSIEGFSLANNYLELK